jgi:hypothetical protein
MDLEVMVAEIQSQGATQTEEYKQRFAERCVARSVGPALRKEEL